MKRKIYIFTYGAVCMTCGYLWGSKIAQGVLAQMEEDRAANRK